MGLNKYKINPRRLPGGYYIIEINEKQDPFTFVKILEESLLFEHMEFDAIGILNSTPDDIYYNNQWGLNKISMSKAWNITTGSPSIILGVIDTGIDYNHEDLDGNMWVNPYEDHNQNGRPDYRPIAEGGDLDSVDNDQNGYTDDLVGWDFYYDNNNPYNNLSFHGTAVAGVIAAQTNNDTGVCGIAGGWDSQEGIKIISLKYNTNSYNMNILLSSVGVCQIKMKTAYWIECQLADSTSEFYPGKKYERILSISQSPQEIIDKLMDDRTNLLYASAYMRIIQSYWESRGYSIDDRVDIIATIFSYGMFSRETGEPLTPNGDPQPNWFGVEAVEYYKNLFP